MSTTKFSYVWPLLSDAVTELPLNQYEFQFVVELSLPMPQPVRPSSSIGVKLWSNFCHSIGVTTNSFVTNTSEEKEESKQPGVPSNFSRLLNGDDDGDDQKKIQFLVHLSPPPSRLLISPENFGGEKEKYSLEELLTMREVKPLFPFPFFAIKCSHTTTGRSYFPSLRSSELFRVISTKIRPAATANTTDKPRVINCSVNHDDPLSLSKGLFQSHIVFLHKNIRDYHYAQCKRAGSHTHDNPDSRLLLQEPPWTRDKIILQAFPLTKKVKYGTRSTRISKNKRAKPVVATTTIYNNCACELPQSTKIDYNPQLVVFIGNALPVTIGDLVNLTTDYTQCNTLEAAYAQYRAVRYDRFKAFKECKSPRIDTVKLYHLVSSGDRPDIYPLENPGVDCALREDFDYYHFFTPPGQLDQVNRYLRCDVLEYFKFYRMAPRHFTATTEGIVRHDSETFRDCIQNFIRSICFTDTIHPLKMTIDPYKRNDYSNLQTRIELEMEYKYACRYLFDFIRNNNCGSTNPTEPTILDLELQFIYNVDIGDEDDQTAEEGRKCLLEVHREICGHITMINQETHESINFTCSRCNELEVDGDGELCFSCVGEQLGPMLLSWKETIARFRARQIQPF